MKKEPKVDNQPARQNNPTKVAGGKDLESNPMPGPEFVKFKPKKKS